MPIFKVPGYNIPDNDTPITDNPDYDKILRYTNELKRFTYDIHVLWAIVDRLLIQISENTANLLIGINLDIFTIKIQTILSLIDKLKEYGLSHINGAVIAFDRNKVDELVYEGLDQYWTQHLLNYTGEL